MRLIHRQIDQKTKEGKVKFEPQDAEDMWHLYNLLAKGDHLTCPTFRKLQTESATGSVSSTRKPITLTIEVTTSAFDASVPEIRTAGPVVSESKHVRIGAFHTVQLEPHRALTLYKRHWDSAHLHRLELALDPATDADLGAIVMEEGLAHVLLICRSLTITRARIQMSVPRKGAKALYNRDTSLEKFMSEVFRACEQHLDFDKIKVLLIASPGYVKDQFYQFMLQEASRRDVTQILQNQSKIVLCHASSGHKHAIHEILGREDMQARLAQLGAVKELAAFKRFREMLQKDPHRAAYGPAHVRYCYEMGAIDVLLLTDCLLHAFDVEKRKEYVELVENVKNTGATVAILSTQHMSGQVLDKMSGVAAILRFPLAELDDIEPE